MKQAVIYSRFSPRPSADECKSIEKQSHACKSYCVAQDYEILKEYQDKAMSGGRADNRPELQKALNMACRKKACLVVYSLSRLARNTKDAIEISERLSKAGANLISLSESIDTTTAMGRAFFQIIAVLAELEREQNAERTSNAMIYYQQTGRRMSMKTPYGYIPDEDNPAMLVEDKTEQGNIKEIIRLHKQGFGFRAICRELDNQGREPRLAFARDSNGKFRKDSFGDYIRTPGKWSHQTIQRIIKRHNEKKPR